MKLQIEPSDWLIAAATLQGIDEGRTAFRKRDLARACVAVLVQLAQINTYFSLAIDGEAPDIALTPAVLFTPFTVGEVSPKLSMSEEDVNAKTFLVGAHRTVRDIYHRARKVKPVAAVIPAILIPPGGVTDGIGAISATAAVVVSVVGVAALVTGAWYATEASDDSAQIAIAQAKELAAISKYAEHLKAMLQAGEEIGKPSDNLTRAASAQATSPWYLAGAVAAVMVAGAAGYVARAPNPLRNGHSQGTITANSNELQRAGYSPAQSKAISMRRARASWKAKNGARALPPHLKPARSAKTTKKRTKASTKRTSKSSTSGKSRSKASSKKGKGSTTKKKATKKRTTKKKVTAKAPPKKANPRKAKKKKKKATKKKRPSQKAFLVKQKRAGRSDKQARNDWRIAYGTSRPKRG